MRRTLGVIRLLVSGFLMSFGNEVLLRLTLRLSISMFLVAQLNPILQHSYDVLYAILELLLCQNVAACIGHVYECFQDMITFWSKPMINQVKAYRYGRHAQSGSSINCDNDSQASILLSKPIAHFEKKPLFRI